MTLPILVDFEVSTSAYNNDIDAVIPDSDAGDLIFIAITCDYSRTFNTPSGFQLLSQQRVTNHLNQSIFFKEAAGTETTVNISLESGSEPLKAVAMVVHLWSGDLPVAASNQGASTNPLCPDLTAATDALVLRLMSFSNGSSITITGKPATEIETSAVGTGNTDITTSESKQNKTGPGAVGTATFTASGSSQWIATTVLIYGSGGALQAQIEEYPTSILSGSSSETITGFNFEASQGAGNVSISQNEGALSVSLTETSWTNTEIEFNGLNVYSTALKFGESLLTVAPDNNAPDAVLLNLLPQNNWAYTDLISVNADGDKRITALVQVSPASVDLIPGSQIAHEAFLRDSGSLTAYGVIVSGDGAIQCFDDPPYGAYTLAVRAWHPTEHVWSASVNLDILIGPGNTVDEVVCSGTASISLTPKKKQKVNFSLTCSTEIDLTATEKHKKAFHIIDVAEFTCTATKKQKTGFHIIDVAIFNCTAKGSIPVQFGISGNANISMDDIEFVLLSKAPVGRVIRMK